MNPNRVSQGNPLPRLLFILFAIGFLISLFSNIKQTYFKEGPHLTSTPDLGPLIATAAKLCASEFDKPIVKQDVSGPALMMMDEAFVGGGFHRNERHFYPLPTVYVEYPSAEDLGAVICIKEQRQEAASYSDGRRGFYLDWDVRFLKWPEGTVVAKKTFSWKELPNPLPSSLPAGYANVKGEIFNNWIASVTK